MDLIHSQNVITSFALFFHRCYLLNTVILVTMYMMVVMVADRMIVVRNLGSGGVGGIQWLEQLWFALWRCLLLLPELVVTLLCWGRLLWNLVPRCTPGCQASVFNPISCEVGIHYLPLILVMFYPCLMPLTPVVSFVVQLFSASFLPCLGGAFFQAFLSSIFCFWGVSFSLFDWLVLCYFTLVYRWIWIRLPSLDWCPSSSPVLWISPKYSVFRVTWLANCPWCTNFSTCFVPEPSSCLCYCHRHTTSQTLCLLPQDILWKGLT